MQGRTNKEIANILYRSPRTIENRIAMLYQKAGVNHFDDFRAFCEQLNYDRYLPKRFLTQHTIAIQEKLYEDSQWEW